MDDDQIQKTALRATMKSAGSVSGKTRKTAASTNGGESSQGDGKGGQNEAKDNDWIPTQAVRKILQIRDQFNGQMSETCISQILYELNSIWRDIMRKENNAIKKRLTAQIQDLRRQIVTKQAFDKGELMNEISRTKKELAFANKKLYHNKVTAEGAGGQGGANQGNSAALTNEVENSMKLVETINNQKRALEMENEQLKT